MTVMGTVEWSPNVRHENLKCGVCRTASLPPSLTGFSCHNAGDPLIGIVQLSNACTLNRWPAGGSSWRSIMSAGMQNRDQWMSTTTADARSNK